MSGDTRAGSTEEDIRAATVGEPAVVDGPIVLSEYDTGWPALFVSEAERVRSVLGDRVMRLEHVGSTSVPGLAAKPIIDMVLVVADSGNEAAYVPALEANGYVLRIREPEWFQHRVFKGPDTNINMHVFSAGCEEVQRMLAFRDHLRTNRADRDLYLAAKSDLAARTWKFVQNYADAKTAVIDDITTRAGA